MALDVESDSCTKKVIRIERDQSVSLSPLNYDINFQKQLMLMLGKAVSHEYVRLDGKSMLKNCVHYKTKILGFYPWLG